MGRKDVGFTAVTTGRFDELHIEIGNLDNGRQTEMRSSFSGGARRPGVRHRVTMGRNTLTQGVLVAQVNIEIDPGRSWPRVGYECPRSM